MAYRDYKVIVKIPYGRKVTVEILFNHLYANKDIVDEVWLLMNTDPDQKDDVKYADQLEKANPGFVVRKHLPKGDKFLEPKQLNTGKFYKYMTDPETIYIRMDDDLVYIHDDFFKNLVDFRIDNPQYFVVMGHVWNNSIISYIQQNELHNIGLDQGKVENKFAMDAIGWMSPTFAEYIHNILLDHIDKGTVEKLFFDKYELVEKQRFSVSCFAFFGKDFAKFKGDLKGAEEEQWITEVFTRENDIINAVCGTALVSHYAFFAQRPHLEFNTDIRERYKQISQQKLSDSYYKLLNKSN